MINFVNKLLLFAAVLSFVWSGLADESKDEQAKAMLKTSEAEKFAIAPFSKAVDSAITYLKKNKYSFDNDTSLIGFMRTYYIWLPTNIKSKFKKPDVPVFVVTFGHFPPDKTDIKVYLADESYDVLYVDMNK